MLKQTTVTSYFEPAAKKVKIGSPERTPIATREHLSSSPYSQTHSQTMIQGRRLDFSAPKKKIIDDYVTKREQSGRWPYMPKFIIYEIMRYLSLRECAQFAMVCKFWKICYHNIYFSYCFFREFDLQQFSEQELATVLRRTSPAIKHITQFKEIIQGQRLGPLLKKTSLTTTLANNHSMKGSMLESFRLEPRKQQSSVFLTDKNLVSICKESSNSLQSIQLISCQLITGQGFEVIKICTSLRHLNIQHNSHLNDQNLQVILPSLTQLEILILNDCSGIVDIMACISKNLKLQRLDLCNNINLILDVKCLKSLQLRSISLRETIIDNDILLQLIMACPQLTSINLENCQHLNSLSLILLHKLQLERVNFKKINLTEFELYKFVLSQQKLKQLIVTPNLISQRIENLLQQHR